MRCRVGGYDHRLPLGLPAPSPARGSTLTGTLRFRTGHDVMDIFTVSAHMRQRWRIIKSVVIILHYSLSVGYFSPGVFFSSSSHCTNAIYEIYGSWNIN